VIVCRQCGQEAREGVDFCESCGAFLEWEGEKVDAAPKAADPPSPPETQSDRTGGTPPSWGDGPPPRGGPAGPWIDMPPDGSPAWTVGSPPAGGRPAPAPAEPEPAPAPPVGGPPPPTPLPPAGGTPGGPAARSGSPAPASVMCLECGATNTGDRRFCRRCGASLETVALARRSPAPSGGVPAAPTDPGTAVVGPVAPGGPPATARPPGPQVPDAPRVMARTPTAPPAKGLKPAEATARPPATRPASGVPDVAPGGPICSQCGTANPPGRRFCRRCGESLAGSLPAEAGGAMVRAGRPSWWQRVVTRVRGRQADGDGDGFSASRSARSAYRHSLDVRYRVFRVMALIGGAALIAGSLGFTGVNPMSGARSLWDKVFPRDKRIGELQGSADPEDKVNVKFAPGSAVDGDPETAWAAVWLLPRDADAAEACADKPNTGGADAALVVTMPQKSKLSKLSVQPGLPAGDSARGRQFLPTKLELRFDDGSCDVVDLEDKAGFQDHRIKSPVTQHVRIAVLDAKPPTEQLANENNVTLGELRIYRPR
jgi:hypothetical protein